MIETLEPTGAVIRTDLGRGEPLYADEPRTLAELFAGAAQKHDLPTALNYKRSGEWRSISSGEMVTRAGNIALGLNSLGLRRGDKAAILSSNSPEWTLFDAGCQFAGVIDVPIYTTTSPSSIEYILNDARPRVFFLENKEMFERVVPFVDRCDSLECFVLSDDTGVRHEKAITLAELERRGAALGRSEPELLDGMIASCDPDEIATLIYTSGTTGEPKGVMLSHNNIISNVIDAGEKYSFSERDVPLSVLPLSHVFERSAMYLYIYNGMSVHYAESVEKVPENLKEVRPTIFVGVPRIFEKVYAKAKLQAAQAGGAKEKIFEWAIDVAKDVALRRETGQTMPAMLSMTHKIADRLVYRKLREFFGGRLRFCITGGAALSDDIFLIFTGAGIRIMQGYGLTETSPVLTSNNPSGVRLGTVGRPIRNVRVRVAPDGEIEATGPGVMLGYYKKEQATRDAFTEDGWLRTGDIGEIDEDGYLRITDRKKELFKTSGGKYIAPSPIEQLLRSSRFVSQAVLIGNERKFAAALIVPNFDMLDSYAKHKGFGPMRPAEYCRDERIIDLYARQIAAATAGLGKFETVKKFRLLETELTVEGGELTPTLKLRRRIVDEKYKELIDEMYAED